MTAVIPAYQNLAKWSEDLTNAVWNANVDVSVTANQIAAPDGTTTADLITATGAGGVRHYAMQGFSIESPYQFNPRVLCMSCYMRRSGSTVWADLVDDRHTDFVYAWFNLQTGVVGTTTADSATARILSTGIEAASITFPSAHADWWRCWMVYLMLSPSGGAGPNAQSVGMGPSFSDGSQGYNQSGEAIYAWGAQLVCGPNRPGPYIKTEGTTVNTGSLRNRVSGRVAP